MKHALGTENAEQIRKTLLTREKAPAGREGYAFETNITHRVFGQALNLFSRYPHRILLGMGCFWGAERLFWQQQGVLLTAAGYAGGYTPFPSYDEVCTGLTGHTEVVAVAYDPEQVSLHDLLALFWENHDPTQGMRQGNDQGSQYRSAIYCLNEQGRDLALESLDQYQKQLELSGKGRITTEVRLGETFYLAEPYHQQYLDANPGGYCGLKGTGVRCMG